MHVVSMKLPKEIVKQLDLLVGNGIYRSRNDALRALIKAGLEREMGTLFLNDQQQAEISKIVQKFKTMGISLKMESNKTAAELVAEGRER